MEMNESMDYFLKGGEDKVIWQPVGSKTINIKSTWQEVRVRRPVIEWWELVWFQKNIPRHAFVRWMAIKGRLSARDKLLRYGMISHASCYFCNSS